MVTETWIPPKKMNDPHLSCLPLGYKILLVPRPHRRGGGVAMIYREWLTVKSHESTTAKSFEGLEVVMTINSNCIRIVVLYRPPPSVQNGFNSAQFITEFTEFMAIRRTSSEKLIIAGDFNYHWDNPKKAETRKIIDMLSSANLKQHVTGATQRSGHTLDWVLTRESDDIVSNVEISSLISDHHFIHWKLKLSKPILPMHRYVNYGYNS